MNIITGYRGEPHITSAQSRDENKGSFGVDSYILNVGQKLNAEISSANEIRIRDGALSHQGCVATIDSGAYDALEIANGTQGMQRRDLIVARYTKDAETNVEDISLVVIQGTAAASNPADPSYNTGNIQNGDSPVDMPLYRVNISGVNISSVTQLAAAVRTQKEMDTLIGSTSISGIGNGTLTGAVSTLNSKTRYSSSATEVIIDLSGATDSGCLLMKYGSVRVLRLALGNATLAHNGGEQIAHLTSGILGTDIITATGYVGPGTQIGTSVRLQLERTGVIRAFASSAITSTLRATIVFLQD